MGKLKDKTLCKLVKDDALEKHLEEYKELVARPHCICTKCGRVSEDPKRLCKPEKLD